MTTKAAIPYEGPPPSPVFWKPDMQPFTVVFDLDGTLVDTAPDLINAANHVLAGIDVEPVPDDVLRPFISIGSRRMIVEGLAFHGRTLDASRIDAMWQAFLAHYAENIAVDSRPYPGVEAVLEDLQRQDIRIAVCTNKMEALSRRLLKALELDHRFATICGRDTFPVCKPHPDHLLGAISAAGGIPANAIMVGDSDTDVSTAKAAGVPIIGVGFGYTEIPMHTLEPDALIGHYREFGEALRQLRTR
jgi:phosphoglycolate phosphatase